MVDFDQMKREAPSTPDYTCPDINTAQSSLACAIFDIKEVMDKSLEELRGANEQLRESSRYWYECAKALNRRIEELEDELTEAQAALRFSGSVAA